MKKEKILLLISTCLFICALFTGCADGTMRNNSTHSTNRNNGETEENRNGGEAEVAQNSREAETSRNSGDSAISIMELSAKELESPRGNQNPSATTVAKGANDFAFRFSAALLAKEAGTGNFVCSPYSVWIPLAALVNATDERYKEDLLTALSAAGISDEDINSAASRMMYSLTRQQEKAFAEEMDDYPFHDPLKIANAIFVGNNVTLKKGFAQTFLD